MSLSMLATPSAQSSPSRSSTLGSTSCYPLTSSSPSNSTPTTSHQQSSQPNPSSILNPFFDNILALCVSFLYIHTHILQNGSLPFPPLSLSLSLRLFSFNSFFDMLFQNSVFFPISFFFF